MIDINEYLERLDEEEGREEQEREAYQRELFEAYVLRRTDHEPERRELMRMYRDGHPLTGPRGLRKRLAAIDLGYFGRAYLKHYFVRKSPQFHEELDVIWTKGVLKSRNPIPGGGGNLTYGWQQECGSSSTWACKIHKFHIQGFPACCIVPLQALYHHTFRFIGPGGRAFDGHQDRVRGESGHTGGLWKAAGEGVEKQHYPDSSGREG